MGACRWAEGKVIEICASSLLIVSVFPVRCKARFSASKDVGRGVRNMRTKKKEQRNSPV